MRPLTDVNNSTRRNIDSLPADFRAEIANVQSWITSEFTRFYLPDSGGVVNWALRGQPLRDGSLFGMMLAGCTMGQLRAAVDEHTKVNGPIPGYGTSPNRDEYLDAVALQLFHRYKSSIERLKPLLPADAWEDTNGWAGLIAFAHVMNDRRMAAARAAELAAMEQARDAQDKGAA